MLRPTPVAEGSSAICRMQALRDVRKSTGTTTGLRGSLGSGKGVPISLNKGSFNV